MSLNILWYITPFLYCSYLITSDILLIISCTTDRISYISSIYFIGLLFEIAIGVITISTYYLRKNNNAIYASIIINLYAIIMHGLILYLSYHEACNIIYIIISFAIIGDISSIVLYSNCIITLMREDRSSITNIL